MYTNRERKVACATLSRTPAKMWQASLSDEHFWTPISLFCICRSVSTFYLLCVCIFFSSVFGILFLDISTPLQNAEGRKTATRRRVLSITEFEVIFHCAHPALVSNGSRCLQNLQRDTRCEGSGRFQNINYKKKKIKKRKRKKKQEKGLWANVCFTQAEPLGRCWQDTRQMTALGWLFRGFEAICLHVTGCVSFSTFSRIDWL